MRKIFSFIGRAVKPLIRDLIGLAGCSIFVYGVWMIHQPAAYMVAGAALVGFAWLMAQDSKPKADK